MRKIMSIGLLGIVALGIILSLARIPFGAPKTKVGGYYIEKGREETGAENIVTAVVVNYRGFDTLGEVAVLFIAAIGLGAVLATRKRRKLEEEREPASLVLYTGCRFLFPLILLFGAYIFIYGHLMPGGGFQGGAIIASAVVLIYLGCRGRVSKSGTKVTASLGGLVFVLVGLIGLVVGGGYFLSNFPPKGILSSLFSAFLEGLVFVIVGAALAGVIDNLMEESG